MAASTPWLDEKLLKKASRLSTAASAVDAVDVRAVAATYCKQAVGAELDVSALAALTMDAALKASLAGQPGTATELASKEVKTVLKKKAREAQREAFRAQKAAEDGPEAYAARVETVEAMAARAARAVTEREERFNDDALVKRAQREERAIAAATRRSISEARARFRGRYGRMPPISQSCNDFEYQPTFVSNDPAIRRARSLCTGVASVVAQLEEQNQLLKRKAELKAVEQLRPPRLASPQPILPPEDQALIAKARELLVDYKPPEQQRRPPVPTAARAGGSQRNSPKGLDHANQLLTEVSVEITRIGRR